MLIRAVEVSTWLSTGLRMAVGADIRRPRAGSAACDQAMDQAPTMIHFIGARVGGYMVVDGGGGGGCAFGAPRQVGARSSS